MGKNTKKTKKKMISKNLQPFSKQQTYSENMLQDGNQDHSTDSYQERPSIFTEIWPSSEPSSPSDTPTSDKNVQTSSTIKSSDLDTLQSSVLARYVDRFRYGQPQSREERQQKASNDKEEQLPFWWASSLPPISTPEESDLRLPCHNPSLNSCRRSTNMSDTSQCELVESEILQLQERASRLLQKGEFCLEEDSLPVSSDGVGCSDFSSPVNADEPVRRPMISSSPKNSPLVIPSLVAPLRPEEDILFQWRLRRKMEKAREWTQAQQNISPQDLHSAHPVMTLQTISPPDLPHGTKHQQIREPHLTTSDQQIQATIPTTTRTTSVDAGGSLGSPPQALAHVPSHMHLLCDILPCPNQHSHPHEGSVSQRLDSTVAILPQTTLNSVTKCMSPPKTPTTGSAERDLHLSETKSIDGPKKHPEKSEKNASGVSKEHKKSAGVFSRHKISLQQKQKYREGTKSRADAAPLPSPIHSTLGQVVSEVMFPSSDSAVVQEISPATPSCSVLAPKQSDSHISGEVISQLLQEAEDSDEKEFEDDPLLQVLRKQRKWVKEQINEVDTLLKELPEEHKV